MTYLNFSNNDSNKYVQAQPESNKIEIFLFTATTTTASKSASNAFVEAQLTLNFKQQQLRHLQVRILVFE